LGEKKSSLPIDELVPILRPLHVHSFVHDLQISILAKISTTDPEDMSGVPHPHISVFSVLLDMATFFSSAPRHARNRVRARRNELCLRGSFYNARMLMEYAMLNSRKYRIQLLQEGDPNQTVLVFQEKICNVRSLRYEWISFVMMDVHDETRQI
jgi:hypothetical protein